MPGVLGHHAGERLALFRGGAGECVVEHARVGPGEVLASQQRIDIRERPAVDRRARHKVGGEADGDGAHRRQQPGERPPVALRSDAGRAIGAEPAEADRAAHVVRHAAALTVIVEGGPTIAAGLAYTSTSGILTFAAGETEKTVPVPVLDDLVDEGEETFTLRLSNATGARIADAEATGTISNSDPLQKMWLSRFGRTVADHVVDAVAGRLSAPLAGAQVTVGGQSIDLSRTDDDDALLVDALHDTDLRAGSLFDRRTFASEAELRAAVELSRNLAAPVAHDPPALASADTDRERRRVLLARSADARAALASDYFAQARALRAPGAALGHWAAQIAPGLDRDADALVIRLRLRRSFDRGRQGVQQPRCRPPCTPLPLPSTGGRRAG